LLEKAAACGLFFIFAASGPGGAGGADCPAASHATGKDEQRHQPADRRGDPGGLDRREGEPAELLAALEQPVPGRGPTRSERVINHRLFHSNI